MNTSSLEELKKLIAFKHNVVSFGSAKDAVDQAWIVKAEHVLNRPLSVSYKWFLENYAGGEIGGEEIYSLYGVDFETVNGGDIVFQYLVGQKAKLLDEEKLVVSETDLGEVFFFDYSYFRDGECPIFLRLPSGRAEKYADNFYEFLIKRIEAHS